MFGRGKNKGSDSKSEAPPEPVSRQMTVLIPIRMGEDCYHVTVTANSMLSKSELTTVWERYLRQLVAGEKFALWESIIREKAPKFVADLQSTYPRAGISLVGEIQVSGPAGR